MLLAALFYGGAKLSLALAVTNESIVMLWIPNGFALAWLIHNGWRRFGWFAATIFAAELVADAPTFTPAESLLFGAINLFEISGAYALLRRFNFTSRFETPGDMGVFVLAGPVTAAATAAMAGALVYTAFGGTGVGLFEFQRVWWFSDGTGLLLITPLALSAWPANRVLARAALRWFDVTCLGCALVVLVAFVLSHRGQLGGVILRPFVLLMPVIYTAVRFDMRLTASIVVVFSLALLWMTHNGLQPFGAMPFRDAVIFTQEFIIVMSTLSFSLSALLAQHRAVARALEERVEERTAKLRQANVELEQLASIDPLTGLLNRRSLFAMGRRELDRARRHGRPLAAIQMDVDYFKRVNDIHGHAAGDRVLQAVADAARIEVRANDGVARYGGEEFVIVAPDTDLASARQFAERLRARIAATTVDCGKATVSVTISAGVAVMQDEDREIDDLFRRADVALYAAKARGRNQVVAADPD